MTVFWFFLFAKLLFPDTVWYSQQWLPMLPFGYFANLRRIFRVIAVDFGIMGSFDWNFMRWSSVGRMGPTPSTA